MLPARRFDGVYVAEYTYSAECAGVRGLSALLRATRDGQRLRGSRHILTLPAAILPRARCAPPHGRELGAAPCARARAICASAIMRGRCSADRHRRRMAHEAKPRDSVDPAYRSFSMSAAMSLVS